MKQLICEMCGSVDLIKQDGVFVCQTCGCKYSVEEARKMMIEGTVSIDGVVKTKNDDFEVRAGELIAYHGAETDVIIPNSIKIIGNICFQSMQGIESVTIPEGVYKIRGAAFRGCSGLKKITFPQSLAEIEGAAFEGCTSLKSVQLPDDIQAIGSQCFQNCKSIESIRIPNSIQTLFNNTFYYCSSLKSVRLSEGIQSIGVRCFSGCSSLKSINFPDALQRIDAKCFEGCKSIESIHIPDSIQGIAPFAFAGTSALITVELPNSLYINSLTSSQLYEIFFCHDGFESPWLKEIRIKMEKEYERAAKEREKSSGCYIATAVYGSYDCPQVWTLRRYRDDTLAETWYGRAFIRAYYAISPILVKWFGHTSWFKKLWRGKLDRMVFRLNSKGVEDTPYQDRVW